MNHLKRFVIFSADINLQQATVFYFKIKWTILK